MNPENKDLENPLQIPEIKSLDTPEFISSPTPEIFLSHISLDKSAEGIEHLVYEQEYTKTPQVIAAKHYINYTTSWMLILATEATVCGLVFRTVFSSKVPDFSYLFFFLSISSLVKITLLYYFALTDSNNSQIYGRSVIDCTGNTIVFQSFYFYLTGIYPETLLIASVSLNFVLLVSKLFLFKKSQQSIPFELLFVFEALLYFFAAIRVIHPKDELSWTILQILGTSIFYALIYLCSALSFFVLLFSVILLFRFQNLNDTDFAGLLYIYVVWILASGFSAVVCLGLISLKVLFEFGLIKPFPFPFDKMPDELASSGLSAYFFAFLLLTFCGVVQFKLKTPILRKISNSTARKVWLKKYFSAFTLNLVNVSGNFFKGFSRKPSPEIAKPEKPFEECVVCQNNLSSYLFLPCNHCVLCEECVGNFLEFLNKCPICKTEISRGLHLNFDLKDGRYSIDKAFKLATD